mgnify:CR=1 FL=1
MRIGNRIHFLGGGSLGCLPFVESFPSFEDVLGGFEFVFGGLS